MEKEQIKEIVRSVLDELGIDLVDFQLVFRAEKSILRVFVDESGGISIERCTQASRAIADVLDRKDIISSRYMLEVSSPGVDRPLKTKEDFTRNMSRKVKISYLVGEQHKEVVGRIQKVENDLVFLKVDEDQLLEINIADVDFAKIMVEFK